MLRADIISCCRDWIDDPDKDLILQIVPNGDREHRLAQLNLYYQGCSEAVPYVIGPDAMELSDSVAQAPISVEDFKDLAESISLPFETCWFELDAPNVFHPGSSTRYGCLVTRDEDKLLFFVFVDRHPDSFFEPLAFFAPSSSSRDGYYAAPLMAEFMVALKHSVAEFDVVAMAKDIFEMTSVVVRKVVATLFLMQVQDSPLSIMSEPAFSRQSRRALERRIDIDLSMMGVVNRIRLNAIGRSCIGTFDRYEWGQSSELRLPDVLAPQLQRR